MPFPESFRILLSETAQTADNALKAFFLIRTRL